MREAPGLGTGWGIAAGSMVVFACTVAIAQTERTGSDSTRVTQQLQQQQQQLQQVTTERTALQADNDKLKQEIETLKGQVAKLQGEQGALQRKSQTSEATASRLTTSAEADKATLERSRTQMQELVARFRETAETLGKVEGERNEARSALGAREQELKVCVDRNAGFYELNSEILTRMEDQGFWSSVTQREPFTRVARTRLENLIDDYRYRVDELRLERQKTVVQ